MTALRVSFPSPGMLKIVSATVAPPRQEMKESPTTVRIPISAFMSACRKNMVRRETPLAFAMRM